MKSYLIKIGKALMLPVAALPLAGLLLRFGVLWDIQTMTTAGGVIFDNLPLLFALSIATALADDHHGAVAVSTTFFYLIFNGVGAVFYEGFDTKVFGGIISAIIVAETYNKMSTKKLPDFLGFFSGKRLIPILAVLEGILFGIVFGLLCSFVQGAIETSEKVHKKNRHLAYLNFYTSLNVKISF